MRTSTSLFLALGVGILGVWLRVAIPVAPVDDAFSDVIRFYRTLEPAAR
ncbi:hypothetical protein [Methylobacterium sp. WL9]|nr:hypothetical protein [Methylobacterium sp. WL9]